VDLPAFLLSKNGTSESIGMLWPCLVGLTESLVRFCLPALFPAPRKGLPENKKPGVERRAKPPDTWRLRALLDFFLPCARREPYYRIYFSPSLILTLGRLSSIRP
jgi:hypothetical protein